MAYCVDPCAFRTTPGHFQMPDSFPEGRLYHNPACSSSCKWTCVDVVDETPAPGGYVRPGSLTSQAGCGDECLGEHYGSEQQWPKRFDTHFIRDNDNKGYPNGSNPLSDDATFIASTSPRTFVPETHPCPVIPQGQSLAYNDEVNVIPYAENSIQFLNDYDCAVMVMVQASNWYSDLSNLPLEGNGGARWLGEARVRFTEDNGATFEDMEWQRAYEHLIVRYQNPDHVADITDISGMASGQDSFAQAFEAYLTNAVECVQAAAQHINDNWGSYEVEPVDPGDPGDPGDNNFAGEYAFPVAGADFPGDICGNYGTCRNPSCNFSNLGCGCARLHAGVDICTPAPPPPPAPQRSSALRAITSGIFYRAGGSGLNQTGHIVADDGNLYTYLHMAERIADGTPVEAGDHVGYVGFLNAWHLHIELHLGIQSVGARKGCKCANYAGTSVNPTNLLQTIYNEHGSGGGIGTTPVAPGQETDPNTGEPVIVQNEIVTHATQEVVACTQALIDSGFPQVSDAWNAVANSVVANDYNAPFNTRDLTREIKTGGGWQIPVLLRPGQGIRVETRSTFSKWTNIPDDDTLQTFCDSGGSTRAGKITLVANPMYGGRRCDDGRFGQPWWDQTGSNVFGTIGN